MRQENVEPDSFRFSKDSECSSRFFQTLRCFSQTNEKGIPHQRCQRIYRKFKECPGRPAEVFEQVEDNIDLISVLKSRSSGSREMTWNEAESDFESLFSRFGGMFSTPWSDQDPKRRSQSISHKLGDYFSYEKEKRHCKQGNEWTPFEKDFTEI